VYARLEVRTEACGESFYQSRMEELVKELDSRGLLSLEDGRKVVFYH
jgi:arginyl-tRNA synthetase